MKHCAVLIMTVFSVTEAVIFFFFEERFCGKVMNNYCLD